MQLVNFFKKCYRFVQKNDSLKANCRFRL